MEGIQCIGRKLQYLPKIIDVMQVLSGLDQIASFGKMFKGTESGREDKALSWGTERRKEVSASARGIRNRPGKTERSPFLHYFSMKMDVGWT